MQASVLCASVKNKRHHYFFGNGGAVGEVPGYQRRRSASSCSMAYGSTPPARSPAGRQSTAIVTRVGLFLTAGMLLGTVVLLVHINNPNPSELPASSKVWSAGPSPASGQMSGAEQAKAARARHAASTQSVADARAERDARHAAAKAASDHGSRVDLHSGEKGADKAAVPSAAEAAKDAEEEETAAKAAKEDSAAKAADEEDAIVKEKRDGSGPATKDELDHGVEGMSEEFEATMVEKEKRFLVREEEMFHRAEVDLEVMAGKLEDGAEAVLHDMETLINTADHSLISDIRARFSACDGDGIAGISEPAEVNCLLGNGTDIFAKWRRDADPERYPEEAHDPEGHFAEAFAPMDINEDEILSLAEYIGFMTNEMAHQVDSVVGSVCEAVKGEGCAEEVAELKSRIPMFDEGLLADTEKRHTRPHIWKAENLERKMASDAAILREQGFDIPESWVDASLCECASLMTQIINCNLPRATFHALTEPFQPQMASLLDSSELGNLSHLWTSKSMSRWRLPDSLIRVMMMMMMRQKRMMMMLKKSQYQPGRKAWNASQNSLAPISTTLRAL